MIRIGRPGCVGCTNGLETGSRGRISEKQGLDDSIGQVIRVDVILLVDVAGQVGERQAELVFVLLPMLVVLDKETTLIDQQFSLFNDIVYI